MWTYGRMNVWTQICYFDDIVVNIYSACIYVCLCLLLPFAGVCVGVGEGCGIQTLLAIFGMGRLIKVP